MTVNLDTAVEDITVIFHQFFRNFLTTTSVQFSLDSGRTWSSSFNVNPTIATNAATLNPIVPTNTDSTRKRVILRGARSTTGFRLKFIFDGDYYFWILDDVSVVTTDRFFYDMQMDPFYALPPSVYTPKEQLENMRFLADVRNTGTLAMNNVRLNVRVWRASDGALVYNSTNSQYPTSFKTDTAFENRLLPDVFNTSSLTAGRYFGSYRVLGDSSRADINPANDTVRFNFWVSDTSATNSLTVSGFRFNYMKENATSIAMTRNADSYWTATEPKSWRLGNYYRIVKGNTTTITTIGDFMDWSAASGNSVQASLYEWRDANNDGVVQFAERTLVAVADTTLPAGQPSTGRFYIFNLKDLNTNRAFYPKDTTNYLAMMEYNAPTVTTTYVRGGFSNGVYDYSAMRFVTDSANAPRYTIILGKTTESDWSTAGFTNSTLTPVVRLNVLPFRLVDTKELSSDNKMSVFPNPVSAEAVNVDVDLVKPMDVALRVSHIDGRIVAEQVLEGIQKNQIKVDVRDYPAGTYILQLLTAEGNITKRFVVAK